MCHLIEVKTVKIEFMLKYNLNDCLDISTVRLMNTTQPTHKVINTPMNICLIKTSPIMNVNFTRTQMCIDRMVYSSIHLCIINNIYSWLLWASFE